MKCRRIQLVSFLLKPDLQGIVINISYKKHIVQDNIKKKSKYI